MTLVEMGGYLPLECSNNKVYHESIYNFNSSRNGLQFYLQEKGIKKVAVPMFTCETIWGAVQKAHCDIIPYDIDENLNPIVQNIDADFIIVNNYFGICGTKIQKLLEQYSNIIIDNSQAFYSKIYGNCAIYSPRKFFGLPDGGMLICKENFIKKYEMLPLGQSYDICQHLLMRHDCLANEGYPEYVNNRKIIARYPIEKMSNLTKNLIKNVDFEIIKEVRRENFLFLHNMVKKYNKLCISLTDDDIPMVYPLKIKVEEKAKLQNILLEKKIYTANYWPKSNFFEFHMKSIVCQKLFQSIIYLPIDQRLDIFNLTYISKIIKSYFGY